MNKLVFVLLIAVTIGYALISATQFRMIVSPFSVMILSGWNCTPWIFGYRRCFTAMIVSSSVHAVTSSSSSGNPSRSMTNEWYRAAWNGRGEPVQHGGVVLGVPHRG